MSYNPDSPVTIADDLPRAVDYGAWAARFSNSNPPDGLTDMGAWGHVARWLAQKGAADLTLRSVGVAVPNLLSQALISEPTKRVGILVGPIGWNGNPLGENARGEQRTMRGMLLWGVNRSTDKLVETWTSNPGQLAQLIGAAIETDPDPSTRLEALKLISSASFPINRWANAVIPRIQNALELLSQSALDAGTRRLLHRWLTQALGRLQDELARQTTFPPLPGGDRQAPPRSLTNWALILGLAGVGAAAAVTGVVVYRRRRQRLLTA